MALLIVVLLSHSLSAQEKKTDKKQEGVPPGQSKPDQEQEKSIPDLKGIKPIAPAKDADSGSSTKEGYWYIDADEAIADAKKNNKSLIINFTGSDWCGWCIKLEGEVFSKGDFSREAQKEFVFLKLDFPRDKSKLSKETIDQNEEYKTKFGVAGFPSIYICDSQCRPFAKTGYQAGGPKNYLAHVNSFREKLTERNELFALAAKADGLDKAELLDRAISLMDEGIVTGHYSDVIEQIVKLDKDNKIGLRKKYWAAQDAEEQRRILAKVDVIVNTLDPTQALAKIDDALNEFTLPPNSRIDALQQKLFVLKTLDKVSEADQLLDQMVSVDGISADRRDRILVQKAFNYVETQRVDEAMTFLNEKIQTYPQSYVLQMTKGEILESQDKAEEAIQAYDVALQMTQGSSEATAEVIAMKAYALVSLDKTDEAISAFQNFVDNEGYPDYAKADLLIQKAMLLREIGRVDAAVLAEKQALEKADSDEQKQELKALIEQLREIE